LNSSKSNARQTERCFEQRARGSVVRLAGQELDRVVEIAARGHLDEGRFEEDLTHALMSIWSRMLRTSAYSSGSAWMISEFV
jgi:hypothetical protein